MSDLYPLTSDDGFLEDEEVPGPPQRGSKVWKKALLGLAGLALAGAVVAVVVSQTSDSNTTVGPTADGRQDTVSPEATTTASISTTDADSGTSAEGKQSESGNRVQQGTYAFNHGVASGDADSDSVVLWTRVTPSCEIDGTCDSKLSIDVSYTVRDMDGGFVTDGTFVTTAARDFTVKTVAVGLAPNQKYKYYFTVTEGGDGQVTSREGTTKTLPVGETEHVRMAVFSCSWLSVGFFHAYRHAATLSDIDVVLHLGDYLYEYGNDRADPIVAGVYGRRHEPDHELTSLSDYRMRHKNYKKDQDLQDLHAAFPFITVWDDHETSNDSWDPDNKGPLGGAENHSEGECELDGCTWEDRKGVAIRAYFEYMPVRDTLLGEPATDGVDERARAWRYPKLWRQFRFGDLADLIMMDTRISGRTQQLASADESKGLEGHQLISDEQEAFVFDKLTKAEAEGIPWKVLGQQVVFADLFITPTGHHFNPDAWEGYDMSRGRMYSLLSPNQSVSDAFGRTYESGVSNTVILTGDIHSFWANEIVADSLAYPNSERLAVEYVATSVTSAGFTSGRGEDLYAINPHVRFVNTSIKGYFVLTLTKDLVRADFVNVGTQVDISSPKQVFPICLAAAFEQKINETGVLNDRTRSGGLGELAGLPPCLDTPTNPHTVETSR
eukprot:Clim_evm62s142 gene=Clim_evmTU62s142